jgi:nicotinamidase-related amidase
MAQNTALVVIDVQIGIIDGRQAYHGVETLERIANLLVRARESRTPVIYIQHDGPEGHSVEVGSLGWQIHPAVHPADGELIIHKRASDAFFETTLQPELTARAITRLIITGCMTEYCVDTTCRRAVTLGYDVTLASDAHTTCDTQVLMAPQIIAHHNHLLDGFDAGDHTITVKPTAEIIFAVGAS